MVDHNYSFANGLFRRLRDMGNGTHAEVIASGALILAPASIADGQTVSDAVDVDGRLVAGIDLGAAFDGTALSIQNAVDGANYRDVYDAAGSKITWTVAAGRFVRFDSPLAGLKSIKLVAGTAQTGITAMTVALLP